MKKYFAAIVYFSMVSMIFAGWSKNPTKSIELAKKQNKFVFLNFTGKKWCGYCIKLEKEIFKKKEFKSYAKSDLVLVELDFPSGGKKPKKGFRELANKYKVTGFPTIIILDPNGEKIGQTGYKKCSPEDYVKSLKKIIDPHKKKFEEAAEKSSKKKKKRK